jgi:hypothetical protein
MKLRITYRIFCFIEVLFACYGAAAQTLRDTGARADSLVQARAIDQAYALYTRLLYFSDSANVSSLTQKLAETASLSGDFEVAADCYGYLGRRAETAQQETEMAFMQIAAWLNADATDQALRVLRDMDSSSMDEQQILRYYFYRGMVYEKAHAMDAAQQSFAVLCDHMPEADAAQLRKIMWAQRRDCNIDPDRIARRSLLFPGLGQFSLGDYKNAVNSILLQAGIIAAGVGIGFYYSAADAIIFTTPFLAHYYLGGARAARELAERKLDRELRRYYEIYRDFFARANLKY